MLNLINLKRICNHAFGKLSDKVEPDGYLGRRVGELEDHFNLLIRELGNFYDTLIEQGIYGQGKNETISDDLEITERELYTFISSGAIYGGVPFFELTEKVHKEFRKTHKLGWRYDKFNGTLLKHFQDSALYSISVNPLTVWLTETLPKDYIPIDFDFLIDSSWAKSRSLDCFGRSINIEELLPPIVKKVGSDFTQEDLLTLARDKLPLFFNTNYRQLLEYHEDAHQLRYVSGMKMRIPHINAADQANFSKTLGKRYIELEKLASHNQQLKGYLDVILYKEPMVIRDEKMNLSKGTWKIRKKGESALNDFISGKDNMGPAYMSHSVPAILWCLLENQMSVEDIQGYLDLPKSNILHTLLALSGQRREICPYHNKDGCFVQTERFVVFRE